MPIRPQAAREVARSILAAYTPDASPIEVSLAASLIVKAVERDEMYERARDAETRLIVAGVAENDSLGG